MDDTTNPESKAPPKATLTAKQCYKAMRAEERQWRPRHPRDLPPDTVLVLGRNGRATLPREHGPTVQGPNGGLHVREAGARFWVPRRIPAGWLTIYVEGDPEPITTREPLGYGDKTLEMLVGKYTLHLVGGGLKTRVNIPKGWIVPVLVGLAFTAGILGVGYWIYKARYGS